MNRLIVLSWLLSFPFALLAQSQPAPAKPPQVLPQVTSPEVHADRSVTFRFRAPRAEQVWLELDGAPPQAMQKGDDGVWSITTAPLEPDFYGYTFLADGVRSIDPANSLLKPNLIITASQVHVPGPPSLPWEWNDVPHGEVHRHFYASAVTGDRRDFYVYTPPGYDFRAEQTYPVLYLLHGFSDDATGWVSVGRANVIFDNLIAAGKVKPMIVVMPLGYGAMEALKAGFGVADSNPPLWRMNLEKFTEALLSEVIPQVEKAYRATKDRNAHAVAGLSMGGTESLRTGLNHLDQFAWIGAFSSGGLDKNFDAMFPRLDARANAQLRLLWISCGTEDRLITRNRELREWLKSKGIQHTGIEVPGAHTWMVWRRNLADFAPLLFR